MRIYKTIISNLKIFLIFLIVGFDSYALLINDSNHTGLKISYLFNIYVIIGFIAFISLMLLKVELYLKKKDVFIILFICLFAIGNIIIFEKYNVMMEYKVWIKKGMPDKYSTSLYKRLK